MQSVRPWFLLALIAPWCLAPAAIAEDRPLHQQIDELILAKAGGPVAPPADDAEFLRRITLDLVGRIPTAEEVRAFLQDPAADKRVKMVDTLLATPEYPQRMADLFHVMLMERLGEHPEWTRFLQTSFAQNKPWDQVTREILNPNPDDEAIRGAAFFLSKRLENYGQQAIDLPGLTRDVGRLFLGRDLQCAQCHDHLFIDDYKQADFQGLFTFVSHTFLRSDVQFPAVGEKVMEKKTDFMSVFVKEPKATGPRLPGRTEFDVVTFPKGEEFASAPDRTKNSPGVPKFRPLQILADEMTRPENTDFAKNTVNRFWFAVMGRGLVHPLDLHHSGNPPTHPELLDLLAREFIAHRYDVKWLLRELVLTETYQRSSLLPEGQEVPAPETYRLALEKPLSTEQLLWSMLYATGEKARVPREPATAAPENADLKKLRERFVKAFANPPREPEIEFAPSVKAALFVLNDAQIRGWLQPHEGNLAHRLAALSEPPALAEELYLSVLGRRPTESETKDVADWLASHSADRTSAIAHLAWALLASTEFAINH